MSLSYPEAHSSSLPACPEDVASVFKLFSNLMLVDPSGWFNLGFRISQNALANLKHEAVITVEALGSGHINSFQSIFMTPVSFWHKYDQVSSNASKFDMNRSTFFVIDNYAFYSM